MHRCWWRFKGLKRTQLKEFPRQGRAAAATAGDYPLVNLKRTDPQSHVGRPGTLGLVAVVIDNGQVIQMFADNIPHKGVQRKGVAVMNA